MHRTQKPTTISMKKRHAWQHVVQTVATDFSRSREREPSNSGTFVRLNMLAYKRAEQTDHEREVVETASS